MCDGDNMEDVQSARARTSGTGLGCHRAKSVLTEQGTASANVHARVLSQVVLRRTFSFRVPNTQRCGRQGQPGDTTVAAAVGTCKYPLPLPHSSAVMRFSLFRLFRRRCAECASQAGLPLLYPYWQNTLLARRRRTSTICRWQLSPNLWMQLSLLVAGRRVSASPDWHTGLPDLHSSIRLSMVHHYDLEA